MNVNFSVSMFLHYAGVIYEYNNFMYKEKFEKKLSMFDIQ